MAVPTVQQTNSATAPRADRLSEVLGEARLKVLRVTILISLLVSLANFAGSLAGFTPSGEVTGPAALMTLAWCMLWALAASFPALTGRAFACWQPTAILLAGMNTATVAATGGTDSPALGVCMYVGWIASVVVTPRAAMVVSGAVSVSIVSGYLLAGESLVDLVTGPARYSAVTNAILPVVTGLVGVLLASVTNAIFSCLARTLDGLRSGRPAATPGLTALFSGRSVPALPEQPAGNHDAPTTTPLTDAEGEVVTLLADGLAPKQIAAARGVTLATVRSQLKTAKKKTGSRTLAELARHSAPRQ